MKKLKISIIMTLLVTCLMTSLSFAATWKNLYIAKAPSYITTNSYTSTWFSSTGDIKLDISAYSTAANNTGILELQKTNDFSTWTTVRKFSKSLYVNGYTVYADLIDDPASGYYRIKFTSTYNVRLDGDVAYFS